MKEPSYRYGKGWSVGCVRKKNPNFPYNAIAVKDGVPISAGCRATYEEAAKAAVGAAYHYGSLNVTQSAKFFAKMGWVFNTNDLVTWLLSPRTRMTRGGTSGGRTTGGSAIPATTRGLTASGSLSSRPSAHA